MATSNGTAIDENVIITTDSTTIATLRTPPHRRRFVNEQEEQQSERNRAVERDLKRPEGVVAVRGGHHEERSECGARPGARAASPSQPPDQVNDSEVDRDVHGEERHVSVQPEERQEKTPDQDRPGRPVLGVWNEQSEMRLTAQTAIDDELPVIGEEPVVAADPHQEAGTDQQRHVVEADAPCPGWTIEATWQPSPREQDLLRSERACLVGCQGPSRWCATAAELVTAIVLK